MQICTYAKWKSKAHATATVSSNHGPALVSRGVSVLELILVIPILLILLLAVLEFGQILASLKQVSLASRVGAKVASELSVLPPSGSAFPADVAAAVQNQLQSNGMTYSRIVLQHDAGGSANCLSTDGGPCPGNAEPLG